MPIITQLNATKLRSLKYGNDTSDGGNSGQPYVKTELKDLDKPLTRTRLTKFDDGLIRGGAIGALNASIVDTIRIGKFLKDFPKGPLFIAKQVGLQLSNPKLETKKGLGGLVGNIGPTRLYNLGINTIAQVPLNAFGGHLMRHGLSPVMDESTKYINVVTENNKIADDNRLVSLTSKFNLGDNEGDISKQFNLQEARRENRAANRQGRQANRAVNQSLREGAKTEGFEFVRSKFTRTDFKRNKLDTKTLTIDSYNGGPKSVYGIGRTIINRYAFTEDKIKITEAYDTAKQKTISGSLSFDPLKEESGFINSLGNYITGSVATPILTSPVVIPLYGIKFGGLAEEDQFKALSRKQQPKDFLYGINGSAPTSTLQNAIGDGEITIIEGSNSTSTPLNPETDISPDKFSVFKTKEDNTTYIGGVRTISPTKSVKASIVNVDGFKNVNQLKKIYETGSMVLAPENKVDHNGFKTQNVTIDRDPKDLATKKSTPFYFNKSKTIPHFDRVDRDILLVNFDTIDPFTAAKARTVVFSAYMSGFKYNSNSSWNPIKYVGRSESFYTFTEHKRDVSFNLQIPCFNKTHLLEKHRGLSELQSAGAGQYSSGSNRLGGVITKITLGNYLVDEPGILTSVSFDIPDVSSWDIDEKLAMYVNAQFSFTIIGKELPTYKEGGFLSYLDNPIGGTGFLTGSQAR